MKKTIKKAQVGVKQSPAKKKASPVKYRDEMGNPRTKAQQKQWEKDELKMIDYPGRPKMKSGGSFPDLNKDGKVTKKDVLIGRGVLPKTAKKGVKLKKAQSGFKKNPIREQMDWAKEQGQKIKQMNIAKKSPAKKMKGGGKCKYGCK